MKEREYRAAMLLESVGEPTRFQILRVLERGPMAVESLARVTKRHQTTVCRHLAVLRHLHLVRYHNRGVNTFYELKHPEVSRLLHDAIALAPKLASLDAAP
jgi:DNA-binding transcriptional ArsR family regulator